MSPWFILLCIAGYFGLVSLLAWFSTRGQEASLSTFYKADGKAPWYLVAFGMIGTSLSGVTFLSVPGMVREQGMLYFQVVLGYVLGYVVIAFVLLPLYYRLNLTSIYGYLGERFGRSSYKTGAWFFLISRALGSAARLYLVAIVLQFLVFDQLGIPIALTVALTLALILLYTQRGGIRTIIWTDTLQTLFMLLALGLTVWYVLSTLDLKAPVEAIFSHPYARVFNFDAPAEASYFWKQFLSGAFITIVMTGLDQDMMQKNLSVDTMRNSQKNVMTLSLALVVVNLLFLMLGVLLFMYAEAQGVALPETKDQVFGALAMQEFPVSIGVLFILGLVAAAYSSADGSLTALTTSFCIDILGLPEETNARTLRIKRRVHWAMTVAFFLIIIGFKLAERLNIGDTSVITIVLKLAGYTYGPLLGLYAYGLFTNRPTRDRLVPVLAILSPLICLLLNMYSESWFNYQIGFELLIINGLLTMLGLWLLGFGLKRTSPTE